MEEAWLSRAEDQAIPSDASEPTFWNAITLADVLLTRSLVNGDLHEVSRQNEVFEAYLGPWKRGASVLKFASVLEQLDFIAAVLSECATRADTRRARLRQALLDISTRLRLATRHGVG